MPHYDFVRLGLAVPFQNLGNIELNYRAHSKLIEDAVKKGVQVLSFPELSLSGYSLGDLFHQEVVSDEIPRYLKQFEDLSQKVSSILFVVGCPFSLDGSLYNVACVFANGRLLGIVPKSFLPSYNEFKEGVYFQPAGGINTEVHLPGFDYTVPFGTKLIFVSSESPKLQVGIEICEDLWAPTPPSVDLALNGATVLLNLSASTDLVGKQAHRRTLVAHHAERTISVYSYVSCGLGETNMDVIFGGQSFVNEVGELVLDVPIRQFEDYLGIVDVDVGKVQNQRARNNVWGQNSRERRQEYRKIHFTTKFIDFGTNRLKRAVDSHPLGCKTMVDAMEIMDMQSLSLAMRLKKSKLSKLVLGVSGGLDSTYAMVISLMALEKLGLDPDNLLAYTMPSFGTSVKTQDNVRKLSRAFSIEIQEVDIRDVVKSHLDAIGHDGSTDLAYENSQARSRYQILFDMANRVDGLVVGTGDLSEIALGWMTYGGDHLSGYNINSGLTKTQIRDILKFYVEQFPEYADAIIDVIGTPISPELIPPKEGEIAQKTEEILGPYEFHDFVLYHMVVNHFRPKKILLLASSAFDYPLDKMKEWMKTFYRRFFSNQFKRSASPDGLKLTRVSLGPRSQWRMPSDVQAEHWLNDLD